MSAAQAKGHVFRNMKLRPEVLKLVQGKIRLLHYALSTEDAYSHWIGRYYDFCLTLVLWDEGPTGQLIIRGAKGGKGRRVPIPKILRHTIAPPNRQGPRHLE